MMGNFNNWNSMMSWGGNGYFGGGFILLALWSLFWKGLALWRAARGKQSNWFIALLVINTAGLLELVYLFFFAFERLTFGSTPATIPKKSPAKSKKK